MTLNFYTLKFKEMCKGEKQEYCITVPDSVHYSTTDVGSLFVILAEARRWFCSGLFQTDGCRGYLQKDIEGEV